MYERKTFHFVIGRMFHIFEIDIKILRLLLCNTAKFINDCVNNPTISGFKKSEARSICVYPDTV